MLLILKNYFFQSFLEGRPKYFNSMEQAIEYAVRSGQIRNSESARVSMTGQIRKVPNGLNEMSKINKYKLIIIMNYVCRYSLISLVYYK